MPLPTEVRIDTAIYALLIAFAACVALCPIAIPYLTRLKFGQNVRGDGPRTHFSKAGTPTMGGVVIVVSFALPLVIFAPGHPDCLALLAVTLGYGAIGFADDWIKVARKRSLGLRAYQKIILQLIVSGGFAFYLISSGFSSSIEVPFTDGFAFDLGVWFSPFVIFTMVAIVNGVNLTDGLDGLASGVTALVATFFGFVALMTGSGTLPALGAAIGALLGFLLFNSHPARVFMGDTGSLALGGFVGAAAILLRSPLLIVVVGLVYVLESLSVLLQVGWFKLTRGKRLFKMAPLHHHFELLGWSETKIVTLFYIVTAIMCLVGYLSIN
ncbi:MAG: phospho-N-acetylmuramoyl-pentapeptide-transferase [Clostridiales bacterium]|nr:phospho-N-acetylmuramoyl-pentapeptide-transferase [Clostridiales bacterium]